MDKIGQPQSEPNLNIGDISIALQAIQLAYSRNAFKMEEVAQLAEPMKRLELWIDTFRQMSEQKENKSENDKGKK